MEEARQWMIKNKINNFKKFKNLKQSKNYPTFIPKNPENQYKAKNDWKSWIYFFGRNEIEFIKYNEAKKIVKKLNIITTVQYRSLKKSIRDKYRLPYKPYNTYKNKGWKNWQEFLGQKYLQGVRDLFSYTEAKKYLKKFKIKSFTEFQNFIKKNKYILDPRLPRSFAIYKKNKTWVNLADYLSYTGDLSKYIKRRKWKNIKICKTIAKKNSIKSHKEWRNFVIKSQDYSLPKYPNEVFQKQWKGWDDFLGKKK